MIRLHTGQSSRRMVTIVTTILLSSSATVTKAIIRTWNTGDGSWSVAANWAPVGVPTANDIVNLARNDGVARTITYDYAGAPVTLQSFIIDLTGAGTDSTSFSMSAGNLASSADYVGLSGRGIFNQNGGTNSVNTTMNVGYNFGSSGAYYLSNSGVLSITGDDLIGLAGNGTLSITEGGRASNANGNLGVNAGTIGAATIDGAGSRWINSSVLAVGASGAGTMSITNGGFVSSFHCRIGRDAGSSGVVVLDGPSSTWQTTQDLTVGGSGTASLTIQNAALMSVGNNLTINSLSAANLVGGTLRFNTASGLNRLNYTSGTIQLAGARNVGSDSAITAIYGSMPTITSGKTLAIEGAANIGVTNSETVVVNGGQLTSLSALQVGGAGNGTLQVTNGGTVVGSGSDPNRILVIGGNTPSKTGSVVVSGAGTSINMPDGIAVGFNANINSTGAGSMLISGGAVVNSGTSEIGSPGISAPNSSVTVTGPGSVWNVAAPNTQLNVGYVGTGTLNIQSQGLVYVNTLNMQTTGTVNVDGGTLRFASLAGDVNGHHINFNSGTLQFAGDHSIDGNLDVVNQFYGASPTISSGKGLAVEGMAVILHSVDLNGGTLRANSLAVYGSFHFGYELLELTGGSITGLTSLTVPTDGEFRASGVQPLRVAGAVGSLITATGDLSLGNAAAVNGFGTQGTLQIGANNVTLLDANDVVFDSLALATIGAAGNPGTLNAANGLTVDFGGNVTGYGTVSTPNSLATPLINNGHITGDSADQLITLPGYVKGVGTFDNVEFTGTFSPGLSPAIVSVGNIVLSPGSTLVVELGGTSPGSGYDQLNSTGTIALDGTLEIKLINGFIPVAGETFDIFSGAMTGAFSTLELPTIDGFVWNTSDLANGEVSLDAAGIPGDFTGDGAVNAADYVVWRKGLGTTYTQADYDVWRTHFGQTMSSGAATTVNSHVPEPATLMLVIAFSVRLLLLRHRPQMNSNNS